MKALVKVALLPAERVVLFGIMFDDKLQQKVY